MSIILAFLSFNLRDAVARQWGVRPFIEVPNRQCRWSCAGAGLTFLLEHVSSHHDGCLYFMLEPHVALFQLHLFYPKIPILLRSSSNAMARNDESKKSLGQAKTSSRQLAARMPPAAASPEPRGLGRHGPAAVGELSGRRINESENATTPPFKVHTFPICDEAVPSSKQGRPRRRYDEEERRQVADTRKRGACEGCKATKTKVC